MINLLVFSIVAGLLASVIIVPLMTGDKEEEGALSFNRGVAIGSLAAVSAIGVFVFYYATNVDRNWTSLWIFLIGVTLLGALASKGVERKGKIILFLVALIFGAYVLSAPLFNANKKYKAVEMTEKVELTAFDETQTPASVPPKFARNKMKKAFQQVPNPSYYELGHLQIQKVKDQFIYIAPVEFSGFFKWFNGKTTPGYFTMSATDSADNPKFVKTEMAYTPSSFFHKEV